MLAGLLISIVAVLNWIAYASSTNGEHQIARWINCVLSIVLSIVALWYFYGV